MRSCEPNKLSGSTRPFWPGPQYVDAIPTPLPPPPHPPSYFVFLFPVLFIRPDLLTPGIRFHGTP